MKQISYAGTSIITGSAVADALVEYATSVASTSMTVAIDIPVLEPNGSAKTHTIMVGPGTQFGVTDVDGLPPDTEDELFPVPQLPSVGHVASNESSPGAAIDAERFNQAVSDVESADMESAG